MNATITFAASMTIDGEQKSLGTSANLNVSGLTSGKQTVGTTYEVLATALGTTQAIILQNTSLVDVSVRIDLQVFTTNEFMCFDVPPDGILVIPALLFGDNGLSGPNDNIYARSASGTADIDYCIIR